MDSPNLYDDPSFGGIRKALIGKFISPLFTVFPTEKTNAVLKLISPRLSSCPFIVLETSIVGPKANSQPELLERNPFKMVRFGMNRFDSRPEIGLLQIQVQSDHQYSGANANPVVQWQRE